MTAIPLSSTERGTHGYVDVYYPPASASSMRECFPKSGLFCPEFNVQIEQVLN